MKIVLIGYGKMGKAIEELAVEKGHTILFRFNTRNQDRFTVKQLQQADVAIEFTEPTSAYYNILKCFEAKIPVVCGSTGWLDKLSTIRQLCETQQQAFLYASNFSIGMNLFFLINQYAAQLLSSQTDYFIAIEELHHTQKKDSPSGTAITLANQILSINSHKNKWVNVNDESLAEPGSLPIIPKREAQLSGTHHVRYTSQVDRIMLTHEAFSRKGFAAGALLAANWLRGKKGIYTMEQVLQDVLNR